MSKSNLYYLIIVSFIFVGQQSVLAETAASKKITVTQDAFITKMIEHHGFDKDYLDTVLKQATRSKTILDAISRPAEKKLTWHKYRQIFIQDKRIKQGIDFIQKNKSTLQKAEKQYGVPPEIITAIIGVETFYGRIAGSYRVIDALNTLAFHYPKRADFFRSELEHFLLLVREQAFQAESLKGSYAGAMGMPQFISSSYRNFAIDFDGDGTIDIWNNSTDAIGSVANYFSKHNWLKGKPVTTKVEIQGEDYKQALTKGLTLDLIESSLPGLGIKTDVKFEQDEKLKLFEYKLDKGSEFWLAHHNFYVITRYNHSHLYAMAVFQLAREIKKRSNKQKPSL